MPASYLVIKQRILLVYYVCGPRNSDKKDPFQNNLSTMLISTSLEHAFISLTFTLNFRSSVILLVLGVMLLRYAVKPLVS